ncbi:MAG: hypothetical protein LQ342_008111 [Letrouitia transgressa]|nr:MAG: hypothetical protein LQ342_008111 [Letrouitia transgressa]
MPFIGDSRRRRHSSVHQKPASQAPAVILPLSPTETQKSNASEAHPRPLRRQKAKSEIPSRDQEQSAVPFPRPGPRSKSKEHVDVFSFIDNGNEDHVEHGHDGGREDNGQDAEQINTAATSPISTGSHSRHYSDLEVNADQQAKRQTWHGGIEGGSFHSDSGISMGSSSGEIDSPGLLYKHPSIRRTPRITGTHEASIPEHYGLETSPDPFVHQTSTTGTDCWSQLNTVSNDNPEAFYTSISQPSPQPLNDTCFQVPVTPPELSPQLPKARKQSSRVVPQQKKHGYANLASHISSQDDAVLKPIYRKFETLNNRILLSLQDEICELEADLDRLDAAIAHEAHSAGDGGKPSSRRAEAKLPSQLQWQRMELMARCAQKIDMYNRTLTSYASLTQTLSPASSPEVSVYRKWISKHNLIVESETSFLRHRSDLLSISQQSKVSSTSSNLKYSPVTVALTILTTIIVFKFVPQFIARVVMSAVIGLALLCVVSPTAMTDLRALREKKKGVGV